MIIKVTQQEFNQLNNWYNLFNKADRIKNLAYELRYTIPHEVLDKRVNFAWDEVKKAEPFKTFDNGILTSKAKYVLVHMKLHKLTNQIIKIK